MTAVCAVCPSNQAMQTSLPLQLISPRITTAIIFGRPAFQLPSTDVYPLDNQNGVVQPFHQCMQPVPNSSHPIPTVP